MLTFKSNQIKSTLFHQGSHVSSEELVSEELVSFEERITYTDL